MTLTPEQLAKKFDEYIESIGGADSDAWHDYPADKPFIDGFKAGWIARQESLVVELPKTQDHKKKDQLAITNMKSGFNVCIGEIKQSLQSAGINYRERE